MATRSQSADRDSAEETPSAVPRPRRARRTRAEPKLYITFLPDGKGGSREEKGSVPLEVDVEDHIEERSDCEPGLYRIEKKRSGEFSGEILFYEKQERAESADNEGEFDSSVSIMPGSSSADVAHVVNSILDSRDRRRVGQQADPMDQFRQMRELLKEEREEMQRQLQEQSSRNAPRDSLSEFERFIELQKKLQPEQPVRDDDLTAKDRAQLILVKESGLITDFMRNIRDALHAPEAAAIEPSGFDKIISLIQSALPYVGPTAGAAVGQKLAALVEHVDVSALARRINTQPQQASAGGQTPGADPRTAAYLRVIRRVALDLAENAPPDASVAATLQLVNTYPELAPQFGQILNAAPGDVATFIYTQIQDDVRTMPHCTDWIASYQSKLRNTEPSSTAPMGSRENESDSEEDGPLTLDDVLHFVKQQIIDDQDSSAAVSSVIQLLAEQPDLAPAVHQLLATSNGELVKILSQTTQTNLTIVANAESFIDKLKEGVSARLRVAVAVSSNGHKSGAASKV